MAGMSIDERLEKLVERHEALTQTVELMAHENRERDAKWDKRFILILDSLDKLTHIAEIHEHRLDSLEGGE